MNKNRDNKKDPWQIFELLKKKYGDKFQYKMTHCKKALLNASICIEDVVNKKWSYYTNRDAFVFLSRINKGLDTPLRIKLAELCHSRWTEWMKYLLSECDLMESGSVVIPRKLVAEWIKEMNANYHNLSDDSKNLYLIEADRFISLTKKRELNR